MNYQYMALSIQYFCLARVGGEYIFNPASANLYHLSFELLLKAYLRQYISAKILQDKYGHNLVKLWAEFKKRLPDDSLDKYDLIIKNLDSWEQVRYITLSGERNASGIEIHQGHAPKEYLERVSKINNKNQDWFSLYLDDMDELFQTIISAIKIDPNWILKNHFDMFQGVKLYEKDNKYNIFKPRAH